MKHLLLLLAATSASLAQDYPSVTLTGGYASIVGCHFDTVYGAVTISSDYNLVTDCLIEDNTAASAIAITSGTGNVVSDNRVV